MCMNSFGRFSLPSTYLYSIQTTCILQHYEVYITLWCWFYRHSTIFSGLQPRAQIFSKTTKSYKLKSILHTLQNSHWSCLLKFTFRHNCCMIYYTQFAQTRMSSVKFFMLVKSTTVSLTTHMAEKLVSNLLPFRELNCPYLELARLNN